MRGRIIKRLVEWDRIMAPRCRTWWAAQFLPESRRDWLVLAVFSVFCAGFWRSDYVPPPGYAIGALAVMAAILAFSKPNSLQKVAVFAVSVGFYFAETHAIDIDRIKSAKESQENLNVILQANRDKTREILAKNQIQFGETISSLGDLRKDAESNLGAATKTLDSITGGRSIAVIVPLTFLRGPNIELAAKNYGKFPLTGVQTEMDDVGQRRELISIGTMGGGAYRELNVFIVPTILPGEDQCTYFFFTSAQNGQYQEELSLMPRDDKNHWKYRISIHRWEVKAGKPFSAILWKQDWKDY